MLTDIAPYLGYLASLFLILALLTKKNLRFRWYSLGGNVAFVVYGLVLNAVPVLITNGILLAINAYHLRKMYGIIEDFDLMEFEGKEKLARKFLSFYGVDICKYFPHFEPAMLEGNFNLVVTRDLVIANMFSARRLENGTAEILLNYTVDRFRDYKVGYYLLEQEKALLQQKGIQKLVYANEPSEFHLPFVKKMGFVKNAEGKWEKAVEG